MADAGFNAWMKMMGLQGDQQNPLVMNQMAEQAAQPATPLRDEQPAPMPPPTTPANAGYPSVQSGLQLGLPDTSAPDQSAQASSLSNVLASNPLLAMMMSQGPTISPQMEKEMAAANTNAGEALASQGRDIETQKALAAQYAAAPRGTDYRPLASALDSWFGGNLSEAAKGMAPESADNKLLKQLENAKGITAANAGLTKDQMDFIKQKLQQQSYVENRASKEKIAKLADLTKLSGGSGLAGKRLEMQEKRLDLMTEKEARGAVNNDQILKQFVPRLEGAAKIGELIQSAREGKVVKNNALLGQLNAEIARLETGSQSPGLGQAEKTELMDAAAQLGAVRDRVTGKPTDSVRPEVIDAAGKLVTELSGSYKKGIDARMDMLRSGMRPNQQKIVDEKHTSLKQTYGPRLGGWGEGDDDAKAVEWAKQNRGNADAEQILQIHGIK